MLVLEVRDGGVGSSGKWTGLQQSSVRFYLAFVHAYMKYLYVYCFNSKPSLAI